jgi:hypothetical protein
MWIALNLPGHRRGVLGSAGAAAVATAEPVGEIELTTGQLPVRPISQNAYPAAEADGQIDDRAATQNGGDLRGDRGILLMWRVLCAWGPADEKVNPLGAAGWCTGPWAECRQSRSKQQGQSEMV